MRDPRLSPVVGDILHCDGATIARVLITEIKS